ncbi:hypothetical protein HJG60_008704 [Phyllostomus discolor]|uniref:Secreted protein n=1 Tax=Phyllostomus discolor TaxID=89673 RepID=A0A834DIU3_9CHIR|nr:hypothetical protein HJG60_008704 [Phyllostomus discolor]
MKTNQWASLFLVSCTCHTSLQGCRHADILRTGPSVTQPGVEPRLWAESSPIHAGMGCRAVAMLLTSAPPRSCQRKGAAPHSACHWPVDGGWCPPTAPPSWRACLPARDRSSAEASARSHAGGRKSTQGNIGKWAGWFSGLPSWALSPGGPCPPFCLT